MKYNGNQFNSIQVYSCFFVYVLILFTSCQNNTSADKSVSEVQQTDNQRSNKENENSKKTIVFFGNSLTAGYGLEENEGFTNIIQNRIDSLGLDYTVVNAGLSGETTAGGNRRIDWILQQRIDVFFLELGANDMLRGLDVQQTKKNLAEIIEKVRAKNPGVPILLAGMLAAPNLGEQYTSAYNQIFPDLAEQYKLSLIPFFLNGVAGIDSLNQRDGIHPNVAGQSILAENVWEVLYPIIK